MLNCSCYDPNNIFASSFGKREWQIHGIKQSDAKKIQENTYNLLPPPQVSC